jgi:hypothetical protein
MTRKLLVVISLVSAAVASDAAVDLTPLPTEYQSQGFTYTRLTFKTDVGSIAYNPPLRWTYRGSGSRLQLTPPDKPFAEAAIETLPLPAAAQLDATAMDALAQQVLATAPPGSQNPAIISQAENTVAISSLPTLEVIVGYQALGEHFQKSVIICNFPDTQLVFRFTAKKADFPSLYQDFRRSLSSWQLREAKRPEPAGSN